MKRLAFFLPLFVGACLTSGCAEWGFYKPSTSFQAGPYRFYTSQEQSVEVNGLKYVDAEGRDVGAESIVIKNESARLLEAMVGTMMAAVEQQKQVNAQMQTLMQGMAAWIAATGAAIPTASLKLDTPIGSGTASIEASAATTEPVP